MDTLALDEKLLCESSMALLQNARENLIYEHTEERMYFDEAVQSYKVYITYLNEDHEREWDLCLYDDSESGTTVTLSSWQSHALDFAPQSQDPFLGPIEFYTFLQGILLEDIAFIRFKDASLFEYLSEIEPISLTNSELFKERLEDMLTDPDHQSGIVLRTMNQKINKHLSPAQLPSFIAKLLNSPV